MSFTRHLSRLTVASLLALGLAGCATHYDRKSTNTMMGAGMGAAAGAVVSQGDPWFTLGGAAAGGLLGNILTEDERPRSKGWSRNNQRSPHYHARDRGHRPSHNRHHRR